MITLNLKSFALVLGFCSLSISAFAQLSTPKADVNGVNGDRVTVMASFPAPIQGDLYIAVPFGGGYVFFANQGAQITPTPVPFIANGNFSQNITVIDLPANGIPPDSYTVFQVVAQSGSDPFILSNWIDGGFGQVDLTINQNNSANFATSNVEAGKSLYKSLTCSSSACHDVDPAGNKNNVLKGTNVAVLRSAIQKNPSDMGFLSATSDADLQAITDYLSTF